MNSRIPILLYHRIDGSGCSASTDAATFRAHLAHLHEQGWHSLSLLDFESYLVANEKVPEHHFLLCLENSCSSLASAALPVIREFGFCGVAFIDVHKIGANDCDTAKNPEACSDYLTWQQVRKIHAEGILEFQPYVPTPRDFHERDASEIAEDLLASQNLLSRELELPPHCFNHLAWPSESPSERWLNIAADVGFDFQYNAIHASYRPHSTWTQIPRLCFDGCPPRMFKRRFSFQTGALSAPLHLTQGMVRSVRRACRRLLPSHASESHRKAKRKKEIAFPSVLQ